jgi:DNA polymerase-3 subunit gamma/tau
MDYQVSARKWRPQTFDEVIGQNHVARAVRNAIATKRIAHAYVFSGPRGVGKTSMARILSKALNCAAGPTSDPCHTCPNCQEITSGSSVDVMEIDGASNRGIDEVRELRENVKYTPLRGRYRIYIIDEVHMLTSEAFNALLKTLEEPPPHVVFILATTESHKIPATILSRCQHFNFKRIPRVEMMGRLKRVASEEGLTVEEPAWEVIVKAAEGSLRDGLSLLDQVVSFAGKTVRLSDVETVLAVPPRSVVRGFLSAILDRQPTDGLRRIREAQDSGHDLRQISGELVEAIRALLVIKYTKQPEELVEAAPEELQELRAAAENCSAEELQRLLVVMLKAQEELKWSAQPGITLELALIKATTQEGWPSVASWIERLEALERGLTPTGGAVAPQSPAEPPKSGRRMPEPDNPRSPQPEPPPRAARPIKEASHSLAGASAGARGASEDWPSESAGQPHGPPDMEEEDPPEELGVADGMPRPDLRSRWEEAVHRVKEAKPNLGSYLEQGVLMELRASESGGTITVGYPTNSGFLVGLLQREDTLQYLGKVLKDCFGREMKLIAVTLNGKTSSQPDGRVEAPPTLREQREKRIQDEALTHPMVRDAMEVLGARVVGVEEAHPPDPGPTQQE